VPLSGDVEAPQTGTWEKIVRLIQNAFFKAILRDLKKSFPGRVSAPQNQPLINKRFGAIRTVVLHVGN